MASTSNLSPIRACIFDVDGTLINSEDIYTQIYNNVLREYGKPDLPWSVKALQQSRGTPGTLRVLKWANLQNNLTPEEWKAKGKEHTHLFKNSQLLPGVEDLLSTLPKAKVASGPHKGDNVKLALASSASRSLFFLKTSHLPIISKTFNSGNDKLSVFGDDPGMSEARKKPQPDIFLLALEKLNLNLALREEEGEGGDAIRAEECLVFEDSIAGVEAARRAGMRVVWVPHPSLARVCRGREMDVLMGRTEEGGVVPEFCEGEEEDEGSRRGGEERLVSEDGMAEMRGSLEGFEVGEYGVEVEK